MKQIIHKNLNGSIYNKYYINHLNHLNGIEICYFTNGNIWYKTNWGNGKRFGLDQVYDINNKLIEITYHL